MIGKNIAAAVRALQPVFAGAPQAGALIGGAAAVSYGTWQIYHPAGWIVGGILVIVGVVLDARGS